MIGIHYNTAGSTISIKAFLSSIMSYSKQFHCAHFSIRMLLIVTTAITAMIAVSVICYLVRFGTKKFLIPEEQCIANAPSTYCMEKNWNFAMTLPMEKSHMA